MTPIEMLAQGIGIVAMAMNCLSFQQKNRRTVLLFQLVGASLFAINFFLLGALSGALLNALGVTRVLVFINKEKLNARHPAWLIGYSALYILSYVLVFTVFGKEPTAANFIVEALPVIAMVATTISHRYDDARAIRRFGLVSSPLWLTYNIVCFSVGAIICETISILSIIIGILRFDRKKSA